MDFCSNCGQQLVEGAKYCFNCGAAVNDVATGERKSREHVYVGVVKKCPVCGEELPSMVAVCPSCGHEINSTQVHPALQKLIEDLDLCEQSIADEELQNSLSKEKEDEHGWRSWSTAARVLWIIANILTLCLPVVVYFLFQSKRIHKSAPSIKRKADLIENFQIPSERQAIVESLYFIRDKVSALANQKVTSDTVYWSKLWSVKGGQIYKKAQNAIPNDATVSGLYHDINLSVQQVKTALKRKVIVSVAVAIFYIAAVVFAEAFIINRISQTINIPDATDLLPILWGFCGVILMAFFVWTLRTIPDGLKGALTIGLCVVALIFSVKSCQNKVSDFTEQIADDCKDNNMILSDMEMNELTKVASIKVQTSVYDKNTIDKAESDLFDSAHDSKFELEITFLDEEGIVIRESKIDEYGVIKHNEDNTGSIIPELKNACKDNNATLTYVSTSNKSVSISVQANKNDIELFRSIESAVFAVFEDEGFLNYAVSFSVVLDDYGRIVRTVERDGAGKISIEESSKEYEPTMVEQLQVEAQMRWEEAKCNITILYGSVYSSEWWRIQIDESGNTTIINKYDFEIAAAQLLKEQGAELNGVYFRDEGLFVRILSKSKQKKTISKIEEQIISLYQTISSTKKLEVTFYEKDADSNYKTIREILVDKEGNVTYSEDNAR